MANRDPTTIAGETIRRVEQLKAEQAAIVEDIKLVIDEAVAAGVDRKALTDALKVRQQDDTARREHSTLVESYARAAE